MRVLFCSSGSAGHLRPMLPLADAFVRRGHAVGWATAPDALPALEGMDVERFAIGLSVPAARQSYRQRWPEALALRGEELSAHTFPRLFGGVIAPSMVDDLDSVLDRWQPALVINEVAAIAAPLACARRRIRHVTHGYGLRPPSEQLARAMREFGPRWHAAGLAPPDDAGLFKHLYLDIAPPSLQGAGGAAPTQALSPASTHASTRPSRPNAWRPVRAPSRRPRVYLSFGTVFNRGDALRTAAQALAVLDIELVIAVGLDGDPGHLGPLPAHVHVERYVDQAALLPLCDAVASHAGAGTMLGAAAHALPQLLLPQAADQFRNAQALVNAGAGLQILPDASAPATLTAAMHTVLTSAAMRAAACRLAAEIAAMPSADDVVSVLDRFDGPGAGPTPV